MKHAFIAPIKLIIAIVFFIVGWVLGNLVAKAFEHVISALKIDKLFESVGMGNFFRKAGMNLNTGYFIGQVVKWFVIIVFLLPSLISHRLLSLRIRPLALAPFPALFPSVFFLI